MKKALGLAILASLFAAPAFAGETFVRNEDFKSHTYTESNLMLDSKTDSRRDEEYTSWADKMYVDGEFDFSKCGTKCGSIEVSYDDFTVHRAGAELEGSYWETNYTHVYGDINSKTNAHSEGHESSAGVR